MLFSATTFIQSLFNGGIFYNLTGLAISLLILEYFRVKEKFYWKEQREKSLTDIQSTHTL
jgi:hypothetical protein